MRTFNKEQLKRALELRPPGVSDRDVIERIISNGDQIVGFEHLTRDNVITNNSVDQVTLSESQREIFPQEQEDQGFFGRLGESIQSVPIRALRGFGNESVREGRQEVSKGFDLADVPGDLADVAGKAIPFFSSVIGGTKGAVAGGAAGSIVGPIGTTGGAIAGGAVGGAAGGITGEAIRQAVGLALGANLLPTADNRITNDLVDQGILPGEERETVPQEADQRFDPQEFKEEAIAGGIGGALGPALKPVGKAIKPAAKKIASILTNISDDVFVRAFHNPDVTEEAIKHVAKNSKQPFFDLANRTSKALIAKRAAAKKAFGDAAKKFIKSNPSKTIDISSTVDDAIATLDDFGIKAIKNKSGGIKLQQGQLAKYTKGEIDEIQKVLVTLSKAKKLSAKDLFDIDGLFTRAYDAIPERQLANGITEPKAYHAIITRVKKAVVPRVRSTLPKEIDEAYKGLSETADLMQKFGSKLTQKTAKGRTVRDTAESFIQSLSRKNRGARRLAVSELEDALGFNLVDAVQLIDDAIQLSLPSPATGGRTIDVIRSLAAPAIGATAGAPAGPIGATLGAGVAIGATSPVVAGKITTLLGRLSQNSSTSALANAISALSPSAQRAFAEIVQESLFSGDPRLDTAGVPEGL